MSDSATVQSDDVPYCWVIPICHSWWAICRRRCIVQLGWECREAGGLREAFERMAQVVAYENTGTLEG